MKHAPEIAVVAAFLPELEDFERARHPSVSFACLGIGLVDAALGMERALVGWAKKPASVILVGSCGAYPGSGLVIGDVVVPSRACLSSGDVAEGRAALLSAGAIDLDVELVTGLRGASHGGVVATTLGITTDDALASTMARVSGAVIEHLEVWAVARVCGHHGVPFAAALGVANDVGPLGREQWQVSHRVAERAAASVVEAWLTR